MLKNPVMFTVYIGTLIMLGVCIWIAAGETSQGSLAYNLTIFGVLFITVLFGNFAEAIAEAPAAEEAAPVVKKKAPAKKAAAKKAPAKKKAAAAEYCNY